MASATARVLARRPNPQRAAIIVFVRAVDWFVERLVYYGVEWIATLPGHGLEAFTDAARRAGLRLIDTRTEQTAAYLAECWGRLTRRPGVCAVSSGPGHVNALAGLADACFDRAPMLLVSGAGPLRTAGLGGYQDLDQVAAAAPLCDYARALDRPERTVQLFEEAFAAAARGPAHVTFPSDVQTAEIGRDEMLLAVPRPVAAGPEEDPATAARLLAVSSKPLIVAGSGVYYAGAGPNLVRFAERFSIPVVQPIWDRGIFDRRSPVFAGIVGATSGSARLLGDADCILMAGAAPDYRVGFLQPGSVREDAEIVWLERGWDDLAARTSRSHEDWLADAVRRTGEFQRGIAGRRGGEGVHAVDIVNAIREVLTDETCLAIDGGNIGQWAHQLMCDRYPGRWLTCGRSGTLGWGIGGAMAARLAYPDAPVLLLAGDGAFTFNVAEIETAVRHGLHFVAVVADDQGWGQVKSELGAVDFVRLAESLGARGMRAAAAGEIRPAIEQALRDGAATVIHVPIVGGGPS